MNGAVREGQGNRASTVLGRRLGGELLKLRDAAGKTQVEAAQVLSATNTKIVKMERGWVPMRDPDIKALCDFYGVDDADCVGRLLEIARLDRERRKAKGWWREFFVAAFGEYVAMEDIATRVRIWQLALVPGLLQAPEYIRALAVTGDWWQGQPEAIETMVGARLKRQSRLHGDGPLQLHAVIWEGALRQQVGGVEVMRAQLNYLLELSQLANVHIQVLPFRVGAHVGGGGAFNLLSFAEPGALDVGYAEGLAGTIWVESREANAPYVKAFEDLSRLSLAPHDSRVLIESISKGM